MLVVASGTAPATAPNATIQFQGQPQLQPDGSALVTVDYTCLPSSGGTAGFVGVSMQQDPAAAGEGDAIATCDDQKHQVTLNVVPGPYHPGSAAAIAFCGNFTSGSNGFTQAELLVKK